LLFMRNARAKAFSEFLIGFGLLFLGLDYLKFAVPPPSPEALAFLGGMGDMGLLSVVLFVIIGIFLTVVVQSSSAAMALTLVLCEKGTIGYDMAAAIVLGENIGTTITANIASLVGNVWAKRAARSHLVFNVFGVAWMLLLFHPVLGLLDGIVTRTTGASPYDDPAAVKWALTYLHIGFNLANTLLFIGFIPFLVKVVTWMV
ncbi:MAG: Na/Pi cotransporter family protein, partial [Verrucomicrobiae bacterium]|nr:Na/Pi cotransporter family protein [Verrucomicrobiae bacterium]